MELDLYLKRSLGLGRKPFCEEISEGVAGQRRGKRKEQKRRVRG